MRWPWSPVSLFLAHSVGRTSAGGRTCCPAVSSPFLSCLCSVIPKRDCVFSVETDGFLSYIYGSKFQFRSSERSAKKFKAKGTIDL